MTPVCAHTKMLQMSLPACENASVWARPETCSVDELDAELEGMTPYVVTQVLTALLCCTAAVTRKATVAAAWEVDCKRGAQTRWDHEESLRIVEKDDADQFRLWSHRTPCDLQELVRQVIPL